MNYEQFEKAMARLAVIMYGTGNVFWSQFLSNYKVIAFDLGNPDHNKHLPEQYKQLAAHLELGSKDAAQFLKNVMPDYWLDGWNIVFNPSYIITESSDNALYRKVFHECIHDMLKHMEGSVGREQEHWDVATDMITEDEINKSLSKYAGHNDQVQNCTGTSSADIYWQLMEDHPPEPEPEEEPEQQKGQGQPDDQDSDDDGDDGDGEGQGQGQPGDGQGKGKPSNGVPKVPGTTDNHDWSKDKAEEAESEEGSGESKQGSMDKAMGQAAAAAKASDQQGSIPGFVSEYLGELLAPKTDLVSWVTDLVSEHNDDRYSMTKVNAGLIYCAGVAVSSRIRDVQIFNMLIYLDTSGSVSREALQHTFSEIYELVTNLEAFEITIIMGDVGFEEGTASVFTVDQDTITKDKFMTAIGRGGTDLSPIIDFINSGEFREKCYDCIIVETDLYVSQSEIAGLAKCQEIAPLCMLLPTSHSEDAAKHFDMCFPLDDSGRGY